MIVRGSALVKTYLIDFVLLNTLLSDGTISRSIKKQYFIKQNKSDFPTQGQPNQRLFLFLGTINLHLNEKEMIFDSIHLISHDSPTIYQLDPSKNREVNSIEVFYPLYSGDLIKSTSRRHSLSMTRSVENILNFRLVPSEIEVNNQLNTPTEFSDL